MKTFCFSQQELSGFQMIEASAGCGKTYTITSLFLRLLTESDIDAEEILTVTFTDAAAAELKDRIRTRIKDTLAALKKSNIDDPVALHLTERCGDKAVSRLKDALRKMDRVSVSTIHGFCMRVLMEQAFESGVSFDTELITDKTDLFQEIACDFYAKTTDAADRLFLMYLEEKRFGPSSLISLLNTFGGARNMRILPTAKEAPDPTAMFSDAADAARKLLAEEKQNILLLFEKHPGLNRRSYSKRNVPAWLNTLEHILSAPFPSLLVFEAARKFSSAALKEKTAPGMPPPEHPLIDAADRLLLAEQCLSDMLVQLKLRFINKARDRADSLKKERGIQTFDDLLASLHAALCGPSAETLIRTLREKYKAVLIDEFQDTDEVQFEIFNRIFGGTDAPFFVIGDPKQAVYAFRGGDIYTYLDATKNAGENRRTLDVNYRSDPSMIHAVNTLFKRARNPFLFEQICFEPVFSRKNVTDAFSPNRDRGALEIRFLSRAAFGLDESKPIPAGFADKEMIKTVAADIRGLIGTRDDRGNEITPSRIAVLVRTNAQAQKMRQALCEQNIRAALLKDASVFAAAEAEEIGRLLRAVHEPARLSLIRAALSARIFGMTASRLASLSEDSASLDTWIGRFISWQRTLSQSGIFKMFQEILSASDDGGTTVGARILSASDGERVMTNLRHLMELIERQLAESGMSEAGLIEWFDRRCAEARQGEPPADEAELRLESDKEAVRVLTMHKSKGLEFDIVFCTHLWSGRAGGGADGEPIIFHDPSKNFELTADLSEPPSGAHSAQAAFEQFAETLRLAYVALTRAKQRCFVFIGAYKSLGASPAGRLFFGADTALDENTVEPMTDEALRAGAAELERISEGAVHVSDVSLESASLAPDMPRHNGRPLTARKMDFAIPPPAVTASFTSLTHDKQSLPADPLDDARDYDRSNLSDANDDRSNLSDANDDALQESASTEQRPGLLGFEKGSRAGTCLHAIFERMDFETPAPRIVSDALEEHGFDASWAAPLYRDLLTVLNIPFSPRDPASALCHIPRYARLDELSFLFPTKSMSGFSATLKALFSSCCAVCGSDYAASLAALGDVSFSGYMKGFIDLVFEHRGRYYIVDYKSNSLGDRVEDYNQDAVKLAMAEHHYYLQYHIYTAALHRYLSLRLEGYDFEQHFGGVYYLFIRGMTDRAGRRFGIFFDRPTLKMTKGLLDVLNGTPPELPVAPSTQSKKAEFSGAVEQLNLPGFLPVEKTPKKKRTRKK